MKSHSTIPAGLLSMALLLAGGVAASATATANAKTSATKPKDGIVTLKINPHHVEVARRRERQRKLSPVFDEAEEEDMNRLLEANEEQYRRREDAAQVGALFEGYGTHYIDLWCGTPPQRQTVIVDTGSGITAFPCSECKDCGVPDYHANDLFREGNSETFRASTCTSSKDCIMSRSNCQGHSCKVGMAYAEGSRWNAYEAVDRCYVAGPHEIPLMAIHEEGEDVNEGTDDMDPMHAADLAFDMTFGCQTLATNLFKTQLADGIMGMSNQRSTYWNQLFRSGNMGSKKEFALCFSRPPLISKEGTEAGAMTLGGVDERLHKTPMVYTPGFDQGRTSFFSVKVRRMMLRDGKYGESATSTGKNPNEGVTVVDVDYATLNHGGIIVDSGTTDTYWNSGIKQQFGKIFMEYAGWKHDNNGHKLSDEEWDKLPTILLQLESSEDTQEKAFCDGKGFYKTPGLAGAMDPEHPYDVILAIPPSHYMEYNYAKETFTSRFYPTERGGSVLGANAMMGHDVFFDIDGKRIGWAESECNYTQTVKDLGYDFDITGTLKEVQTLGGKGNKHSTNGHDHDHDHADHADGEEGDAAEETCEDISSGKKCQQVDGCAWGWGKCTTKADTAANKAVTEPPTAMHTHEETDEVTDFPTENAGGISGFGVTIDQSVIDQAKAHQSEIRIALAVLSGLLVFCCGCCCYLCCCNKSSQPKYSATNLDPISIEMTNGMRGASGGFQDEPDESFDEDDDSPRNGFGNGHSGHTNGSSGKRFRDDPLASPTPEFDGDFA